jgi:hypothetical protein
LHPEPKAATSTRVIANSSRGIVTDRILASMARVPERRRDRGLHRALIGRLPSVGSDAHAVRYCKSCHGGALPIGR